MITGSGTGRVVGGRVGVQIFGVRPLVAFGQLTNPAVLGVVLHLVVSAQPPTAVGQGQQERRHPERDDDGGEDHRLRQRVGHRGGVDGAHDGR
jgi:hypothetical protein